MAVVQTRLVVVGKVDCDVATCQEEYGSIASNGTDYSLSSFILSFLVVRSGRFCSIVNINNESRGTGPMDHRDDKTLSPPTCSPSHSSFTSKDRDNRQIHPRFPIEDY